MIVTKDGVPITRALFTPAELAAFETIYAITRSLIRQRAVCTGLAEEFAALATAALQAGGDVDAVMQHWVPIRTMMETCTDPASWTAVVEVCFR